MEIADVEKAAQGRIFSGTRALEEGLVDSVGGLNDALKKVIELAEIADSEKIRYKKYPEPTFMEKLMESMPDSVSIFPGNSLEDNFKNEIEYRLKNNGKVLPILPLDFIK